MTTLKTCVSCKQEKELSSFHLDKASKDGKASYCKECACIKGREYHKNRYKIDPVYRLSKKRHYIKARHGITLEKYNSLLKDQNYSCSICSVDISSCHHYDHDHKSGQFRSFLCTNCNRGLGHFQDNPELLEMAIKYLQQHSANVDSTRRVDG